MVVRHQTEVQTVTTATGDSPTTEEQLVVLESTYSGVGATEVQRVVCDASGGQFGLTFLEETAFIEFDATASEIQAALEELTSITTVAVTISNGTTACL